MFGEIIDDSGVLLEQYYACKNCFTVAKNLKTTTSNLLAHKCIKKVEKNGGALIRVPTIEKDAVKEAITKMTISDLTPFKFAEKSGFKNVVQVLIQLGAKFGSNIDIDFLLPSAKTVSTNVENLYNSHFPVLKEKLKKLPFKSYTTDLWSDNYKRLSYIGLTVHYITDKKIFENTLAVKPFNVDKQSGEKIREKLKKILLEYETDILDQIFVTDRGSNVVSALRDGVTRLSCADHILNNILSKCESFAEFKIIIRLCSKYVKFFKKSNNLQMDLVSTLKSHCPTR